MIDENFPHILVTGLPRSGTSFVTEILHCDLGIRMATTIGAPNPGTSFLDYEDLEVGHFLLKAFNDRTSFSLVERWMKAYRKKAYLQYSQAPLWGFKSPLILFFPFECVEHRSIVIKTKRDPRLSKRSINNLRTTPTIQTLLNRVLKDCEEHYRYVKADIIVDFDERDFNRGDIREFLRTEIKRVISEKFSVHEALIKI